MASFSKTTLLSFMISISITTSLSASIIEELNQLPPPDFGTTVSDNCLKDRSLRYCNSTTTDLLNIFKSTIVAKHLCVESNNPNCNLTITKIDLRARPNIAPLYMSFSFFWKYCPTTILTIDLSNNSLKGSFLSDILLCTQIQALDLSFNELTGDVPLESLVLLPNLSFLNLSYNRFSESNIEKIQFFKKFNSSSFLHSGILFSDHPHGFKITTTILLLIVVSVSVVSLVIGFGCLFLRRPDLLPSILRRSHVYTTAMLKTATGGFSDDNLVWNGGGVEIYRGIIRDGSEVEIRIQRGKVSSKSHRIFVEDCRFLIQLSHKNLIKVLGWCDQRELRAVVTERRGVESVEKWLLGSPPWKQRLKVLMGVVEGMCYLQVQWPCIRYDLRTNNVMLSEDEEPLISNLKVGDQSNEARKVYKFGLFLLELVTKKRPGEGFEKGESGFLEWMRMHYPSHVRKVIDERMKFTSTTYEQMKQVIGIGLACTNPSTDHLPSVTQIFAMLPRVCLSSSIQPSHSHQRLQKERGKDQRFKETNNPSSSNRL